MPAFSRLEAHNRWRPAFRSRRRGTTRRPAGELRGYPQRVTPPLPADLFGRYLDLRPLRGRDRGLVRCRFHEDHTASLSVDLVRGLFHCFGCGVGGGVRRFAELVGENSAAAQVPVQSGRRSLRDEAFRAVILAARRQSWMWARELYAVNAFVRDGRRRVFALRAIGHARADWHQLAWAARLETLLDALEHALETAQRQRHQSTTLRCMDTASPSRWSALRRTAKPVSLVLQRAAALEDRGGRKRSDA